MADSVAEGLAASTRSWAPEHIELFRKLLQNIVDNPAEAKFRKVKLSNARIGALFAASGVAGVFEALGWQSADGGDARELPSTADLQRIAAVLRGTAPQPPGESVPLTVLRGTLKVKLELPSSTYFGALTAALEQHPSLGHVPRSRQRLLAGYPPKHLEECHPGYATMSIGEMGLKAIKLEDAWEELVADLRAGRASFAQLEPALACRRTVEDHRSFLLETALALLKSKSRAMPGAELLAARRCFHILWPAGDTATRAERVAACAGCTALAVPGSGRGGELKLCVERVDIFASAISQIGSATTEDLARPLQVSFVGEAAEDAGGPRREFFNEFGRAATNAKGVWSSTPIGTLRPSLSLVGEPDAAFRSCGRVFGLALCQAENAAQEQTLASGATFADLLAAVRAPEEGEEDPQNHQQQQLLVGAALSRAFLRSVLSEPPETLQELQAELNAEQLEGAPDFRGSAGFLQGSLEELGLAGTLTFSYLPPDGGSAVELVPGQRDTVVTEESKKAWLEASLSYELAGSMGPAAAAFRAGACEAGGAAYLVLLSAEELGEVWFGRGRVEDEDLRLWQQVTKVNPARKQQACWFFEVLWEPQFAEMRPRVLKFATGSDRWPADSKGFTFSIEPLDGGDEKLPRAMTCGNMLQLPSYTSQDALRANLIKACEWGRSMDLV